MTNKEILFKKLYAMLEKTYEMEHYEEVIATYLQILVIIELEKLEGNI